MNRVSESILRDCKEYITRQRIDSEGFKAFWKELPEMEFDVPPDWAWLYQKVYIHLCLFGQKELAEWIWKLFQESIDPIQQIAYRQTYSYGQVLLRNKKA